MRVARLIDNSLAGVVMSREKLVLAYIEHLKSTAVPVPLEPPSREEFEKLLELQSRRVEEDPNFEAWEELQDLVEHDANEAFETVLAIISRADRPDFLSTIGAGPLEDLLRSNARILQKEVHHQLVTNRSFRFAYIWASLWGIEPEIVENWASALQSLGISRRDIEEEYRQALLAAG